MGSLGYKGAKVVFLNRLSLFTGTLIYDEEYIIFAGVIPSNYES